MSGRLQSRRQVRDTIGGAHDSLVRHTIGESDARAEVVEVGGSLPAVVGVDKTNRTAQVRGIEERVGRHGIGDRRWGIEIEKAQPVEPLGARNVEIVAQAEIHGELRRHFPVILEIETPVGARRCRDGIVAELAEIGHAEQQRSHTEAVGAPALVRVQLCPPLAEAVLARRLAQLQEVEHQLAVIHAELESVFGENLRRVDVEAVCGRRDDQIGECILPQ